MDVRPLTGRPGGREARHARQGRPRLQGRRRRTRRTGDVRLVRRASEAIPCQVALRLPVRQQTPVSEVLRRPGSALQFAPEESGPSEYLRTGVGAIETSTHWSEGLPRKITPVPSDFSKVDWDALVASEGPAVWRAVRRVVGSDADAEDVFQEVFVAAVELSRREPVRQWRGLL